MARPENSLQLLTAEGYQIPICWIGISDFDGSLRFETSEPDLAALFSVFSDPKHTEVLTRYFFDEAKDYCGFTKMKGLEKTEDGTVVIRLLPEEQKTKIN